MSRETLVAETLNATQGTLLGLLLDGPKTGWELLHEARGGLARFWNITQSHAYRELAALERRRLVRASAPGPRDRRPFAVTAAGRRAFAAWLSEPPGNEQLRFPLLVSLWFGRHLDRATLAGFVASARAEHQARLAEYRAVQTDDVHVGAVVSFGIHYERAVLDWLDELDARSL
jgi:DNA-binding PadR family transcriptional regulator